MNIQDIINAINAIDEEIENFLYFYSDSSKKLSQEK